MDIKGSNMTLHNEDDDERSSSAKEVATKQKKLLMDFYDIFIKGQSLNWFNFGSDLD